MTLIDIEADTLRNTPAPAVGRAVRVLDFMAKQHSPVTVTQVADALDLAKSSVSNLMTTLDATGMVRRVARGWVLGYRVLELGQSALASSDLIAEFRRLVAKFPTLRRETVLLAVLDDVDVLFVARHNGQQPIRLATDIGRRLPAVVTALGKSMLAALPEAEMRSRLDRLPRLPQITDHSLRTRDELLADLDAVSARGYAVDDQENTIGVTCFGVAVPGLRQSVAVSTTLLSDRVTSRLRAQLINELQQLAAQLGGVTHD
ncbi:IclR family transcriptional regulator [Galbitalea sp. SE-J8]|uniref:IclR family transcriptional regulator n=1 Tax=Galbitalea sp. SE-J8 TaxID=3054952 RepID=UPI00259CBFB4|nr:IclR family transcriptional regulator [Galbitalea sp. SE-J8]MDM4763009.1 IclR family transcriptional regulator [Galbitalea sp. SE-J8]